MATDHLEGSEFSWRRVLPWTELFKGFQVALDLNKLLLAAGGILVMHLGWWLLSVIFAVPLPENPVEFGQTEDKNWALFQEERLKWNLMHEAADLAPGERRPWEVADLAQSEKEYNLFKGVETGAQYRALVERLRTDPTFRKENDVSLEEIDAYVRRGRAYDNLGFDKPRGRLSTAPWYEDRGPNPYLLVTGQVGIPWEAGHFWEWFARDQLMVMIEPLVKFLLPIIYIFKPQADLMARFYFLCVTLWTLATWSFFGGAITRIAVVQVARGERIGLVEAVRYTARRYLSYLTAPLFPLAGLLLLLLLMFLFGLFHMIPLFGDIVVSGLFWPLVVVLGLLMAIALVGLVGWPLMSVTISAEGHDSWEAVSRSYSYVFQRPWQYVTYSAVAVAYGAVLVFFVGLMASLTVYLAEWGVARIQPQSRDPAYLFVYTPTSFGWRSLLMHDAKTPDGQLVVHMGEINAEAYQKYTHAEDWHWWNTVGAVMMAFWIGLIFLMVLGFGYSFFWSATSIIYLLMRRSIDTAELDEVYLEEEEPESPFGPPMTAPGAEQPKPDTARTPLAMTSTPPGQPPAPPPATGAAPPASPPAPAAPPPPPARDVEPPSPPPSQGASPPPETPRPPSSPPDEEEDA